MQVNKKIRRRRNRSPNFNFFFTKNLNPEATNCLRFVQGIIDINILIFLFCLISVEIVEIFFVDTSPFVNDYFTNPEHNYDWKGISPRETYLANLLKVTLQNSHAYFMKFTNKSTFDAKVEMNSYIYLFQTKI